MTYFLIGIRTPLAAVSKWLKYSLQPALFFKKVPPIIKGFYFRFLLTKVKYGMVFEV